MTRHERDRLRSLVDQAVRARLRRHEARLAEAANRRRTPYWQRYYWENRDRILAARAARKDAAA
jgi:hypothetical protein